jgi:acyl carrier protein
MPIPPAQNDALAQRVYDIIARTLGVAPQAIHADDEIEQLAHDSIQLFELILAFEQEFQQEVDYTDLMHIRTVEDIVRYVHQRTTESAHR